MATTFIDYKSNNGFYINESFIQLASFYISQELKKTQYIFADKGELLDSFNSIINGFHNGYIVLSWDGELQNSTDEHTIIQVLQNVKTNMISKGAFISLVELKSILTKDPDFKRLYSKNPFPTSEMIKIIDTLIQLLNGTWQSTNYYLDINYKI